MDRFIRVNGKDFSFEDVARALGFEVEPHLDPVQVQLCQRVDGGILVAKGAFFDNDDYPAIDLELELPAEKDSLPVLISKTEQPRAEGAYSDGSHGVRNFVYNRDGEYFMYSDVDSRADEVVDRDGMQQRVMVSGSRFCDVEVYQENPWVRNMGQKDFEYAKEASVKLEVGMVGVVRNDSDIKKNLRGKSFEILEVNEEYGCAKCRIEGEQGEFGIYRSQMSDLKMPEAEKKPFSEVLEDATARARGAAEGGKEVKEQEGLF